MPKQNRSSSRLSTPMESRRTRHPDLAVALANLARLYRDREQFDIAKAEPLLIRALSIREKALGHDQPDTVKTLSDLSLLYFYQKKFAAAEEFAARALPFRKRLSARMAWKFLQP